jgi:hypothetical protein
MSQRKLSFSQAHKKFSKSTDSQKPRSSAASSSLPVLTFSKFGPTNFISWSEEIITHCTREYGLLASCLQTLEYPEIVEVAEPTQEEMDTDEEYAEEGQPVNL